MKLTKEQLACFAYLIDKNIVSFNDAVEWAYSQFALDSVPAFVEKISLSYDSQEIVSILFEECDGYEGVPDSFLIGEVVARYEKNKITLSGALREILFHVDIQLPAEEEKVFYLAEDYYDWHDNPDKEAKNIVGEILARYLQFFNQTYKSIFSSSIRE